MIIVPKRELILPKSVRRKQGGFLLNPFRFGGGGGGWITTGTPGLGSPSGAGGWNGYTLRVVIPATALAAGSRIRLQVTSTSLPMTIGKLYLSPQAASGDPYDFAGTPSQMFFGGNPAVTMANSLSQYTDELIVPVTAAAYVASIYFSSTSDVIRYTGSFATGFAEYYKIGDDAATVDAAGYTLGANNRSAVISRIEVWQP